MEEVKLSSENKLISSSWMCLIPLCSCLLILFSYHFSVNYIINNCLSRICWANIVQSLNFSDPYITVWSLLWFSFFLTSIGVWAFTIGICQISIFKTFNGHLHGKKIFISGLTLFIAIIWTALHCHGLPCRELPRWNFTILFLENINDPINPILKLNKFLTFIGFGVSIYVLSAISTSLIKRSGKSSISEEQYLADRMKYLRWALYFGAALMIMGLLRKFAAHKLALAYLVENSRKDIMPIADATVIFFGILYSTFLAALYIPAAMILRARVNILAAKVSIDARDEYLAKCGLSPYRLDILPQLVAIFGPLLTSLTPWLIG